MTRPAGCGIVTIASADLRRSPRHDSELRSQLLLGEVVRVLGRRAVRGWIWAAAPPDGYEGWIRTWAIAPAGAIEARRWSRRAHAIVGVPIATLRAAHPGAGVLMPVFLGSRLVPVRVAGRRMTVRLPDGRLGVLPVGAVTRGRSVPIDLARRLETLMGVPYLWGGRTPAGFDCSGLTQVALAEQGCHLPRDARDQARASRPLRRGESGQAGDLLFFARPKEPISHVGILIGRGTYVHCRGCVRINSLDPNNPLCDKDLLSQVRDIRRPIRGQSLPASAGLRSAKSA